MSRPATPSAASVRSGLLVVVYRRGAVDMGQACILVKAPGANCRNKPGWLVVERYLAALPGAATRRLDVVELLLDRAGLSCLPLHEWPRLRPGDVHRITTPNAESERRRELGT